MAKGRKPKVTTPEQSEAPETPPVTEQPQSEESKVVSMTMTPRVTQQVVTTKFNSQLTALRYQEALQSFLNWGVTTENVTETQEKIKKVRAFMRKLDEIKTEGKKPSLEEGRMWDNAYNTYLQPLQKALDEKERQLQLIVNKIAEENKKKADEKLRVDKIKSDINNFILNQSQSIAGATSIDQLVTIEKLIGSHKGNKFRYQEFLLEFSNRCNELTPLIKKQKDAIKEMEALRAKLAEAEANGNDAVILDTQEQQELLQHSINETKVMVQEAAIAQATAPDEPVAVESLTTEINYRRKAWKWEVADVKKLLKQMPHLVDLVPNKQKIDDLLAAKKGDGSLKGVEELEYAGIRFFLNKQA